MKVDFEQFYYVREDKISSNRQCETKPFATVCIRGYKQTDGSWLFSRGVAICSDRDTFNSNLGRLKSSAILTVKTDKFPKNKTAAIFTPELSSKVARIYSHASRLDLVLPNPNPKYEGKFVRNNRYVKAGFGLTRKDLTKFEKELVKHLF